MKKLSIILSLAVFAALAGCDQDSDYTIPDGDTASEPDGAPDGIVPDGAEDPTDDPAPGDPAADPVEDDPGSTTLDPPAGGSSGGTGGTAASGETRVTGSGVSYHLIAPSGAGPHPLMIVYSGTEGGSMMTSNVQSVMAYAGLSSVIFGILDGVVYRGNATAGADVIDHLRGLYNVDNDRTYLLSESAGTTAGLALGLDLRQSYFAAYWANDVNASGTPTLTASELGFAPYGNAGPGGDWPDANIIVNGMVAAGYRCPEPAPYDGSGSDTHGHPDQFVAAMQWFAGKTRL
ncbi:MAG: hypothetical protein JRG91_12400 [Deltaproteobacteria bacterium]|nr:hypothetical protein [Deltaproteobacteria bacterium]